MGVFGGNALGEDGGSERARVISRVVPLMLNHLPLWAVTNLSVARALPLEPGLFDYVIIDEPSQCDIASAVPLLARARRAVIVGDAAQLGSSPGTAMSWADAISSQSGGLSRNVRSAGGEDSWRHSSTTSGASSSSPKRFGRRSPWLTAMR
jgi:hypothetical protein